MAKTPRWVDQWERVKRWHERHGEARHDLGLLDVEEGARARDDFYSFFINCHALKDWVKNDSANTRIAGVVESAYSASADLDL